MSLPGERVVSEISAVIESALSKAGLMFRVFSRIKSDNSVQSKLSLKREIYLSENRKMQDLIGVRVALYFLDDQIIVQEIISKLFNLLEKTIDPPTNEIFGPTRWNLILRLPENLSDQLLILKKEPLIDDTFELQLRTILSEGWHEVEHDLRYKCKKNWDGHDDLSRTLNGTLATLETADWSMLKVFDDLAYRNYKSKIWPAMLRNKYRLRLIKDDLNLDIEKILNNEPEIGKKLFRIDRKKLIHNLLTIESPFPITANNIVYLCNRIFIKSSDILKQEPLPISQVLDRYYPT